MLITRLKSVLIFAILAAVFSCADPYESSEVALQNSRRAVQPEDIPHVTSKLFDRLGLANGTERFSMASATGDPEFTIDWEKILESIDSSGTATYTFYLHSNATRTGEFYNLVMRLDSENNAYKPFIVRYTMTDEFLLQYLATGSMEGFDGEMSIIPVKGPDSGTEYQAGLPGHVRSITPDKDCPEENIGFDNGSSGGGGGGPSTGGSTGGGGSWVTVTRCDYYLVKNYYETYVDGEYSSTNYYYTMEKDCYEYSYLSHTEVAGEDDCDLGDGEIPIIDPEMAAAFWEAGICETDAFKKNECLQEVWNKLKETDLAYKNLTDFITTKPFAELCLDVQDTISGTINAKTFPRGTLSEPSFTIALNKNRLNKSKLELARTILHETIHAELGGIIIQAEQVGGFEAYLEKNPNEERFAALWNYINNNHDKFDNYLQHNYMIESYLLSLSESVRELSSYLLSDEFKNQFYQGKKINYNSGDTMEWDWNEFYLALAYVGLHKTDAYKSIDDKVKMRYGVYRSILKKYESEDYKCN
ncbi:hypothetical protein [Roseivirga sp.]|uniref:hypothetical protein n=1 Tax=Roseivirga sp. TaxID=1964215 RepID=UPI003B527134